MTTINRNIYKGCSDKPIESIESDEFSIRPYTEGLSEYIKECETPMTIAIQGEWGCGKTSMMYMVKNYLADDIIPIWFNTWQFSQFDRDKDLSITFLNHLVNTLASSFYNPTEKKEVAAKIKSILSKLTVGVISHFYGDAASKAIESLIEELPNEMTDYATEITILKENFTKLISETTKKHNKRIVFFIDDLDRLTPVRAVELLEILKLFVDCENCVFVMAVDTSIVFQGIREKYGNDISESKAQSFFDKMIQLPFQVPTEDYQLNSMMDRLLKFFLDEGIIPNHEWDNYISMLRHATEGNPRSMKRLINSMLLLNKVALKKGLYTEEPSENKSLAVKLLFILTCIQHKFPTFYNFIIKNNGSNFITKLSKVPVYTAEAKNIKETYQYFKELGMPETTILDDQSFLKLSCALINLLHTYISKSNEYITWFVNIIAKTPSNVNSLTNYNTGTDIQNQTTLYKMLVLENKPEEFFELLTNEGIYLPTIKQQVNDVLPYMQGKTQSLLRTKVIITNELKEHPLFEYINRRINAFFSTIMVMPTGCDYTKTIKLHDNKSKSFNVHLGITGYLDLDLRMQFPLSVNQLVCKYEFDAMMNAIRARYKYLQSVLGDIFLPSDENLQAYSADESCKAVTINLYDYQTADIIIKFLAYLNSSAECFQEI